MTRHARSLLALVRYLSLPRLRAHPGRVALVVGAVAIGVSAIVATGNLVASALASLESPQALAAGDADLRVANGFAGVAEELLADLQNLEGVGAAAAISTASLRAHLGDARGGSHAGQDDPVQLMVVGIDLLGSDSIHGDALGSASMHVPDETLFLVRPETVVLPRDFAAAHDLEPGSEFVADLRGGRRRFAVGGLIEPSAQTALVGGALAVMDLPAMQHVFERPGLVGAIDLVAAAGVDPDDLRREVGEHVGDRATVMAGDGITRQWESLLYNVRLILGVAGAVAIAVGALVIYFAAAMDATERKPRFGVVRAVGASRRALLALLAAEALVVGALGAVLGTGMGTILAHAAAGIFEQTVALLYSPLSTEAVRISPTAVVWGVALALGLTLAASVAPAASALRVGSSLAVASPGTERRRSARRLAVVAMVALAASAACILAQRPGLDAQNLANLVTATNVLAVLGVALGLPLGVLAGAPWVTRALRSSRFTAVRLGWQSFAADPARSAVLMVSILIGTTYVMTTFGTVESLRSSVLRWLDTSQTADLVVTAGGGIGLLPSSPVLPARLAEPLRTIPGVAKVAPLRLIPQPFRDRWIVVAAQDPSILGTRRPLRVAAGDLSAARDAVAAGTGTIVSEHLALRHGLDPGDSLALRSPTGPVKLRVAAVVEEHTGGDSGAVFVSPRLLRDRWLDEAATALPIWLEPGADPETASLAVTGALSDRCDCTVSTRPEVHAAMNATVDSVFYTAYALELVAAIVMIVGAASFFTISLAERRQEMALLRTVGATRRQLIRRHLWEAGVIGLLGGGLGCGVGAFLAWVVVVRSMAVGGGMNLPFSLPSHAPLLAVVAAVSVCVLASIVPVVRASRFRTASVLGDFDA